jgi:hypothetical protein
MLFWDKKYMKKINPSNDLKLLIEKLKVVKKNNDEEIIDEIENDYYNKINEKYPVLVGQDFWYSLTGRKDFYFALIDAIGEVALEVDGTKVLEETIESLKIDLEEKFS